METTSPTRLPVALPPGALAAGSHTGAVYCCSCGAHQQHRRLAFTATCSSQRASDRLIPQDRKDSIHSFRREDRQHARQTAVMRAQAYSRNSEVAKHEPGSGRTRCDGHMPN